MKPKDILSNRLFISGSIWLSRIVIGICFIFSGLTKADDPWGTIFKIEQYLSVWEMPQPRSLIIAAAFSLAIAEFMLGIAVLLGIYRRNAPKGIALMMLIFLPLTGYIAVTSPVDDCGCFGDAWVISNTMTFIKNILLTLLTIPLLWWNKSVPSIFTPGLQWIISTISIAYIFIIAMFGFHIQPLIDFRSFPIGSTLTEDNEADNMSITFIYEKDGQRKEFDTANLPSEDSGWVFVDRKEIKSGRSPFIIENNEGDDITENLLGDSGSDRLLLIIPEPQRADLASTMQINQLWRMTAKTDSVSMIALLGDAGNEDISRWQDLSMAEYPIYSTEATTLKELARGLISAVYLHNDTISAKISIAALSTEDLAKAESGDKDIEQVLSFNGKRLLWWLTVLYIGALGIVFIAALPRRLYLLHKLRHKKS